MPWAVPVVGCAATLVLQREKRTSAASQVLCFEIFFCRLFAMSQLLQTPTMAFFRNSDRQSCCGDYAGTPPKMKPSVTKWFEQRC
jgi:hypothetical protein